MTLFWYDAQKYKLVSQGRPCESHNPLQDVGFYSLKNLDAIHREDKCWILNLFVKDLKARSAKEKRKALRIRKKSVEG